MKRSVTPKETTTPNLLDENEARYRLLTESLPQYVWTTDAEGKIDYCNRHFLEYCGLTLEEVQAGRTFEFVHPEDAAGLVAKVEQSRATGRPFEHEYRVRRASDGEYRWHFAHSEQFTDSGGAQRWLGIAMDVTSRKQAEFELRDANERLNGILTSISEWFIVLDREWRIQFVSQRVLDFNQRDWSDIQGRVLWDAFPEAAKTEYKPGYEKVMRERVPTHLRSELSAAGRLHRPVPGPRLSHARRDRGADLQHHREAKNGNRTGRKQAAAAPGSRFGGSGHMDVESRHQPNQRTWPARRIFWGLRRSPLWTNFCT